MCKILCLTSHDPLKRNEIINSAWKAMYPTTSDGFGAAWFSPNGEIGFFKRSHPRINTDVIPDFVQKKSYAKASFNESNDIPSDGGFLIIHGRTATNAVNVVNTHPMILPNAAMVHNGVVRSKKYKNEIAGCTCDSEFLLNAYLSGGISEIETEIEGYYAFMMLKLDGEAKTLHIVKDTKTWLHCGIRNDGAYVFATNETLLPTVGAEAMGEVTNNTMIVFSDKTTYESYEFEPQPYKYISKQEQMALDRAIEARSLSSGVTDEEEAYGYNYGAPLPKTSTALVPYKKEGVMTHEEQWESDQKQIEALEQAAIDEATSFGSGV